MWKIYLNNMSLKFVHIAGIILSFFLCKREFLRDETRRSYIDFFCGAGAVNYGHNNSYIKEKILKYLSEDRILHSLDMYTTAKRDFIAYFEKKCAASARTAVQAAISGADGDECGGSSAKVGPKSQGKAGGFCP